MKNLINLLFGAFVAFLFLTPQSANAFCYRSYNAETIQKSPEAPPQYSGKKMNRFEAFLMKRLLKKQTNGISDVIEKDSKTTQTLGTISTAAAGMPIVTLLIARIAAASGALLGAGFGIFGIFLVLCVLAGLVLGIISLIMANRILGAREANPVQKRRANKGKILGIVGLSISGLYLLYWLIIAILILSFGG